MRYIIVGLGNPGSEYKDTRHNVGRAVVAALQEKWQTSGWCRDKRLRAHVSQGVLPSGSEVVLVLPDTYMNNSGGSVAPLVESEQDVEHVIVVHDDLDLNFGTLRIVHNRGPGGHNGVISIEKALNSKAFTRVKVGVIPRSFWGLGKHKKPQGKQRVHNFILKKMSRRDQEKYVPLIASAGDAVLHIIEEGRVSAMDAYNSTTT